MASDGQRRQQDQLPVVKKDRRLETAATFVSFVRFVISIFGSFTLCGAQYFYVLCVLSRLPVNFNQMIFKC
jgi:hypothetical protein